MRWGLAAKARSPQIGTMPLPDRVRLRDIPSPSAVWADIRSLYRNRGPHTLLFATIAIAIPIGIVLGFQNETKRPPRPPEIIYIQNWSPDRTDADIVAQQQQERTEREAAQKERQAEFKRLHEATRGWLWR